jgi:hypothetical protein
MKNEHPKLGEVQWHLHPEHRYEMGVYKGHTLKIRHAGGYNVLDKSLYIGFIDGKIVGHEDNVPKMASRLLEMADALADG